jgi:cytoskeletal protein RodZ
MDIKMKHQNKEELSEPFSLPGDLLKTARENVGLTRMQLAKRSRLTLNNIQALEENDWHALPALVYVRGFIRIYAREVGIDSKQAIRLLDICLAEEQEAKEMGLSEVQVSYTMPKNMDYLNTWRNQYLSTVAIILMIGLTLMSLLSLSPSTLEANEEDHKVVHIQILVP